MLGSTRPSFGLEPSAAQASRGVESTRVGEGIDRQAVFSVLECRGAGRAVEAEEGLPPCHLT